MINLYNLSLHGAKYKLNKIMRCPVGVVFYASCIELAQFPVTARGCSGVCKVEPRARQREVTFSRLSLATPEGGRELIMHYTCPTETACSW